MRATRRGSRVLSQECSNCPAWAAIDVLATCISMSDHGDGDDNHVGHGSVITVMGCVMLVLSARCLS